MDGQLYVTLLGRIIPAIADRNDCIIVGRGAQFILKDRRDSYHVLLVADMSDRIGFMQRTYQLSWEDARRAIVKQEKRRRKLMKLFQAQDYDLPWHYDMVLNMSKLTMESAAELICRLPEPSAG
jgi:cytidylate kinase